jgi:hypothetical protein
LVEISFLPNKDGTAYQDYEAKRDKLLAAVQDFDVERFNSYGRRMLKIFDDEISTARKVAATGNRR